MKVNMALKSNSLADAQQIPHQAQHHYPSGLPPQFIQGRPPGFPCYPHNYPGVPAGQPGYPGSTAPSVGYGVHMMRPQQQELVRMPQGPTPAEWAAQQQRVLKEGNPPTPASIPAPSPAASSIADESIDEKSRLESPSWANQGQVSHNYSFVFNEFVLRIFFLLSIVGPPTAANPPRVMPERRLFFERLVQFCEQHGEPITMIPQVSKQNVDLHRLYIGVRNRGGFEQVTKDKAWKAICSEANPEISQSSAAGYQLRKHYEKHLLLLECVETGRRPEDAVAFADGLKRQRRKEPATSAVGTPSSALTPFPGYQSGSRAPSTGPVPSVTSPDSSSRMSAGAETSSEMQRPGSAAVGTTAPTPTAPHPIPQPSTRFACMSFFHPIYYFYNQLILCCCSVYSYIFGLETEAIWAINALNVLLYDDTNPHPCLTQMPGLLNVIIEHFWATLSVLYPETFPLGEPSVLHIPECKYDVIRLPFLMNGNAHEEVRQPVATRNPEKKKNYNKVNCAFKCSRTGRKIKVVEMEIPEQLKRKLMLEEGPSTPPVSHKFYSLDTLTSAYVEEKVKLGLGGGLAERVAFRLQAEWRASRAENRPGCCKCAGDRETCNHMLEENSQPNNKQEMNDNGEEAQRALALSNILRGFSFLPGCEQLLCGHNGLLFLLGRFLQLMVTEVPVQRAKPALKIKEVSKRALSLLDSDDIREVLLVETANQLRDDAFVMLSHMSVALDLYDVPDRLSYPIYDGMLHWCSTSVPEATDPIPPAAVSPRNYSLEIICKMSVMERNVDMLVSTGSWQRIEKIVHMLAKMLSMSEETHNREFAIVILNALCNASEAVCYVAAVQSPAIANLVSYIEASDQNMHQVMQTHGMPALRDNPEMMGTSVGMLRRAAAMLRLLVRVPNAYHVFAKFQQRLLQFTMSQLMDSRVAGMIADALFEIQSLHAKEEAVDVSINEDNCKHNGGV
uniref:ARID domain-containing protein n=1 Tax=Angiostrongylus cantonensis TaxID=6313 RepID=A0A0K0CYZ8_ANGCA